MAGVAWPDVRSAFQSLKAKAKRRPDLRPAIIKLSSLLVKLESASFDLKFVTETCANLRQELVLLYRAFLLEMLQLASALFDCIQTRKTAKNLFILHSWEHVQKLTLSGILDYLEETRSSDQEIYETIAEHMFPVMCRYFFPSESSVNYEEISIELKTTVYIFLSDTAKNHSLQRKLRDPKLLGGARFGLELARVRAYLHLEALFELLEKLVPENSDERDLFVDSIFNPALFTRHQELKDIITSLKNQPWDEVFPMIVQIFARMSIRYPQPIPITNATFSDTSPCPSETLYVDQRGLTYNIDVDDAIDTCHIAYHNIVKIRYSRYSQPSISTTTFNFELAVPPTVGKDTPEPQAVTLTISVPRHKRDDFLKALKARGVSCLFDQTERKISLAVSDSLLDFSNQPEDPPRSFPEKSRQVFREMTPSDKILVPSSSPHRFKKVSTAQEDILKPTQVPVKPAKKGRKIVQSDNESEEESSKKTNGHPVPFEDRSGTADAKSKVADFPESKVRNAADLVSNGKENGKETLGFRSKGLAVKRRALEENIDRPSKRSRPEPEPKLTSSPLSSKTPRHAKRYGRRERGRGSSSSPVEHDDLSSNLEPMTTKTTARLSGGPKQAGTVAVAMKEEKGKKNVTVSSTKSKANAKGKVPEKKKAAQAKPAYEPIVVEDAKPTRRSARVAGKQDGQQDKSKKVVGQLDEENLSKVIVKTNKDKDDIEIKKPRPNIDKAEEPAVVTKSATRVFSRNEIEPCPPAGLKIKKEKKAPWEKFDFTKQQNDTSAPSKSLVLELKEPTSGMDLPVQILTLGEFDQGHIDMEIPLQPGSDASSVYNQELSSDPSRSTIQPEMIDLTIDSPIREPQSKASKLAISFLSPAHVVELINENIEPRKHNRIPNLTKDIPRKTEYSSHKASPEFADNIAFPVQESQFHVPTPSVLAPIVSAPLQDQDSFNASAKRLNQSPVFEQESSTLSQHKNAGGIPLPHVLQQGTGLNPAKFFPAVALPRRTALEVSTPLRLPLVKTLFEPPPLIKNVQHHRHVAFAQYSSKALAEERWGPEQRRETEQRYHVRKLHKNNVESSVALGSHKKHWIDVRTTPEAKTADIPDIVEILHDIQEVLINKISNRFDGVKKEVRISRDSILRAAAADIDKMRAESAEHYNALVDLEAEYASFRRYVIQHLEDLCGIDKDVVGRLNEIIQHHDRHGLSKKFLKSLPTVPACFINFDS